MAQFYILNEPFALRGWEKLPYAVLDKKTGRVFFLNAKAFEVLELCDGGIDFTLPIFSDETRNIAKQLEKEGVVSACEHGAKLQEGQTYHLYKNRFIKRAHWSITGKCNYRCKHCYMSAPDAKLGELSHDVIMNIAQQIVDCGIQEVSLTGGEPLVRKDFLELVQFLTQNGIRITQIYSNGKLVTRELLSALDRLGIRPEFNMSYDGDEEWHDWLRGIPNAGKIVLDAFDLCHEMGFPTGAEMCLHKGNLHLLRESINTLAKHHCAHMKTNPVANTELWEAYDEDYSLELEAVFEAYLHYIPHFYEDDMPLSVQLGGFFSGRKNSLDWFLPSVKNETDEPCENMVICGHARQTLYISPEGRMLPCLPLAGSTIEAAYPILMDKGLAHGLSDSSYMELISTRLSDYLNKNEECATCAYRWQCCGGCRASALHTSPDNIMGPDRAVCLYFKKGYNKKAEQVAKEAVGRKLAKS